MRVARIELVSFMVHLVAVGAMNTWDCPFQAWELSFIQERCVVGAIVGISTQYSESVCEEYLIQIPGESNG